MCLHTRLIQVYLVFIKLDLYFFLGFVVQYNLIDVHFDEPEFSLTTVLIPLTPIVLALAVHCVRHETKIGMIAIIVCKRKKKKKTSCDTTLDQGANK